ncbi:MAG: aminodeoxychorismate synthase component I [Candidatus Omnitrophota bacterium]
MFYPLPIEKILSFLAGKDPFVLLETIREDPENHLSYLFIEPVGKIESRNLSDLPDFFEKIETALSRGYYLSGFFSYETGFGFEKILQKTMKKKFSFPLARLYLFHPPLTFDHRSGTFSGKIRFPSVNSPERYDLSRPSFNVGPGEYHRNINKIKNLITSGDTYQVNYTFKVQFHFSGSPSGLYLDLRKKQSVCYSAFIKDRDLSILSLSPELFLRKTGQKITVRPMKGTIGRGKNLPEDRKQADILHKNFKDRSENLMIVDLLRNDLGKVSKIGTVKVNSLFDVEKYETLFQMTSTISADLKSPLPFYQLFQALFPSGSVTGAPKIRTMEIIRELEKTERKVYTGAVGFFSPGRDAVFNIAIRTVLITDHHGEMGVGSGIVFDSEPRREYAECKLKASFLTNP